MRVHHLDLLGCSERVWSWQLEGCWQLRLHRSARSAIHQRFIAVHGKTQQRRGRPRHCSHELLDSKSMLHAPVWFPPVMYMLLIRLFATWGHSLVSWLCAHKAHSKTGLTSVWPMHAGHANEAKLSYACRFNSYKTI